MFLAWKSKQAINTMLVPITTPLPAFRAAARVAVIHGAGKWLLGRAWDKQASGRGAAEAGQKCIGSSSACVINFSSAEVQWTRATKVDVLLPKIYVSSLLLTNYV